MSHHTYSIGQRIARGHGHGGATGALGDAAALDSCKRGDCTRAGGFGALHYARYPELLLHQSGPNKRRVARQAAELLGLPAVILDGMFGAELTQHALGLLHVLSLKSHEQENQEDHRGESQDR